MDGDCGESRSGGDATVGKARPALSRRHLEWRPRLHRLRDCNRPRRRSKFRSPIGRAGVLSELGIASEPPGERDSNPPLPQNETQIAHSFFNDKIAVGGANDYVNGGSQLYRTTNGGESWTTQDRSSAAEETGDFCGGGGDPALTYSRRDHAFYFAQLCFFRTFLPSEIEVIQSTDNGRTWTGSRTGRLPDLELQPAAR